MYKPTNGNYDEVVRECFKKNKNTCISWWLTCSYCYYIRHDSLMSDEAFDKMCKWMLENYDSLEHNNKNLITKEMLSAGSGYNLKAEDYPLVVRVSSEEFIKNLYSVSAQEE